MSSSDFAQISTLIHRLDQLAGLCDPVHLVETIASAISATEHPPPGDPEELRALAKAFRTAGTDSLPVATDVKKIAAKKLPDVWKGDVAADASTVVKDTGDLIGATYGAFSTAAGALETYATTLEGLKRRHEQLRQELHNAMHTLGHVPLFGIDLPIPDVLEIGQWCAAVAKVIRGCVGVYNEALNAADTLVGQLADVKGKARTAKPVKAGMSPADAVVLADTALDGGAPGNGNAVLSSAQLLKLAQLMNKLSPADRAKLDAALRDAKNPLEEAYILKALAAGHSVADATKFGKQIRGKRPDWLKQHLALNVDPNNPGAVDYDGVPVKQEDPTSCGSTAIVMAHAMNDPMYALGLTTDGHGNDLSADQFAKRFSAEQKAVHNQTNTVWPQSAGTSPWGETGGMNNAVPGNQYHTVWVDDTDGRSAHPALRNAVQAVDQGHTVPVMLAPSVHQLTDGGEFHYVLMVGHHDGMITFYDPSGDVKEVPEADFYNGHMSDVDSGVSHVNSVALPGGS